MAAVAPADAAAPSTMPGHFQTSFCTHLGLMHGELSWRCRLHPSVRLVYSALYQSDDLVTGVDNVFFTQVPRCNTRRNVTLLRHTCLHRKVVLRKLPMLFGRMPTRTDALHSVAAGTFIKAWFTCCHRSPRPLSRIHPPPWCCRNHMAMCTPGSWTPLARTRALITAKLHISLTKTLGNNSENNSVRAASGCPCPRALCCCGIPKHCTRQRLPMPRQPQSRTPLALFQQHVTRSPRVGPLAAAWRSLYAGNPGAAASTLHWSEKPSCRYEGCRPRIGRAWVSRVSGSSVFVFAHRRYHQEFCMIL